MAERVGWLEGGSGAVVEGTGAGEREAQAAGLGVEPGEVGVEGHRLGKLLSPERRGCAADHARKRGMSERRACRLVNQPRGTPRYQLTQREDEDALTEAIVELASQYGRYGYRRITALLKRLAGWQGPGGAHLASRRAEGSAEAEAARAAVVQRRIVRAANRRAHERMPHDPIGTKVEFGEGHRRAWPT
jgi:hypothetical protein